MWKTIQKRLQSTDSFVSMALGLAVVLVLGMLIVNYTTSKRGAKPGAVSDQKKEASTTLNTGTPPTTHTVVEGETLWSISEKYYKSGYNWVDVQKSNTLANADYVEVGQVLTIPSVTPIAIPTGQTLATSTEAAKPKEYTVVAGDSLWTIAMKIYADGYKWSEIAKANSLANPDLIFSGNVLQLP